MTFVDELFGRILKKPKIPPANPEPPCLCGHQLTSSHGENDEEDLPFHLGGEGPKDPLYVQRPVGQPATFAVCPRCNPKRSCEFCGGTGHKTFYQENPPATETEEESFTMLSPYACNCLYYEHMARRLNNAQIPERYLEADFNSFSLNHLENTGLEQSYLNRIEQAQQFALRMRKQGPKNQKYFLTLFGSVGTGKTLCATSVLKELVMKGQRSGVFMEFQSLLSKLKAEFEKGKSGEILLEHLRTVDVLLIDELGKGRSENEWQMGLLDDLVNQRYNEKRITLLTTNYLLADGRRLPRWDQEISQDWDAATAAPTHESFWNQNLRDRLGARMYERIIEVSEFIDFSPFPSYRQYLAQGHI